ncbi:hypothetical protein P7K49_037934 [Saguinus oedipus]|uniref:Uncharacterized protein n=1 Tax=Saguinus oedipus TaxID=9490 RepID=A0ABQ9TD71_SAGOE|nr:hypothetical protein P7K49_037934 [Saguinus oedipus]
MWDEKPGACGTRNQGHVGRGTREMWDAEPWECGTGIPGNTEREPREYGMRNPGHVGRKPGECEKGNPGKCGMRNPGNVGRGTRGIWDGEPGECGKGNPGNVQRGTRARDLLVRGRPATGGDAPGRREEGGVGRPAAVAEHAGADGGGRERSPGEYQHLLEQHGFCQVQMARFGGILDAILATRVGP